MFSFIIVLCFILNAESCVDCQSLGPSSLEPGLWKTWSENPWKWRSFLEEQYYDTLRYLEGLSDHGISRHRRKREDKERVSIAVVSIYGEVISEEPGSLPCIFEISGEKEFVVEDNIFLLHKHEKGKLFFELIHILDIVDPITFVESTTYMNETLVLLAHHEYGQLFSLPLGHIDASTRWKRSLRRQKLSSEGNKLVKAKFLHHKQDLYLVVLYRHKKGLTVDSIVYQWKGKYFDEKYTMKTSGAIGISVVKDDDNYFINILQNPLGKKQQESLVYKLEPDAGPQKLQSLRTFGAKLMFNYRGIAPAHDSHVLIINGKGHSDIYRMKKGGEFVPANRKFDFMNITSGIVADIEGEDFLFLGTMNEIFIYKPIKDDLKTLNSFNLADKTILSIDYLKLPENIGDEKHNLIIITRNEFDQIELNVIKFFLERDAIVSSQESDPIVHCLSEVESLLHDRQFEIDKITEMARKAINMESLTVIDDVLEVSREVRLENSRNHNFQLHNADPLHADFSDIVGAAKSTAEKIKLIEDAISHAHFKDESLTFANKIVVSGDLVVENAIATHLNIASINGNPFTSYSFISNSDMQYLPEGIAEGRKIIARHLTAPYFNKFLQSAPVLATLSAESLFLPAGKTVNGINPENIVTRGFPETIMGTKTFEKLATINLNTDRLGKEKLTPWIERAINFETPTKNLKAISNVTIVNLTAKKINGFDVAELMDSTFQRGIHSEVKGNLRFSSDLDIDNLKAESVQGKAVDRFLTKTTEQIVSSDLTFRNILVSEMDADKVNGIDFGKDVALIGRHNAIKTPTTIFNLDVTSDLLLNCGSDNQSFCNIVATRAEDLLQIYNGPVTIQGSVSVPDLKFGRNAKLDVGGEEFHTEVQRLFWMKDKSQVIPQDVFFTKGVSAPQVTAQRVNGFPVEEILSSTSRTNGNVSLHFMDAVFQRDVSIAGGGDCIMIGEMDRSAVKNTGSFHVRGKKTFEDQLIVRSLRTDSMNDIDIRDVVLKQNEGIHFTGELRLEKVRLKGDLQTHCDVKAEVINDVVWKDFVYNGAVKVNLPTTLQTVIFHNPVYAHTVSVESGPLSNVSSMIKNSPKNIDVTVSGSTSLQDISHVHVVNDVIFQTYANLVVRRANPGYVKGHKTFRGQVNVNKVFNGRFLNDFPLERLMNEALSKSDDQIVGGKHIFGDLSTDHLEADSINYIDTKELIDITDSEVYFNSNLSFQNVYVESAHGFNIDSPCDLKEAVKGFQLLPAKSWGQIHVEGPVFWSNSGGILERLFKKAVLRGNDAQIQTEVSFEGSITTNEIETVYFLNNVNIHNINEDSMKRHSSAPQIVSGVKNIKNSLWVNDAGVSNLLSSDVNGIDILLLNATLVRNYGDAEIFGEKTVTSLITAGKLEVPGTVHAIPSGDLPFSSDSRVIKEAHFKSLTIGENLKVTKVNQVLLEDLLENSIKLSGPEQHVYGDMTFENVDINDDSKIESINSMPVRDMIMDKEGEDILVYGDKTFMQDVVLNGPAEINMFNGFDVTKTYQCSIITSEDANIRGDLIFYAPVTIHTDGNRGLVNKFDHQNTVENGSKRLEESKNRVGQIIHEINRNLEKLSYDIESSPTKFLYAEEWSYVDLVTGSCKAAGVRSTAEESFIELHALNPGQYCGLQSYCVCPQHYTIKISADGLSSVQSDTLKYSRIFNLLSPPGYSTNIITTTLAISKHCRSDIKPDPHNERTWISWRYGAQNVEEFFDLSGEVTGFVSDVKSFHSNGGFYAIISQYYDAGLDSYNLNTSIVVLDFTQRTSTTVQRLPSHGAWVMELLETKHGIHLFIGNTIDSWNNSESESQFFRFNPLNYQFELIQSMFVQNCQSAASAILEDGRSFFFIVQGDRAPLLVLRYEEDQHTYSSSQLLHHDAQVLALSVAYVGRNPVQALLFLATSAESLVIYELTGDEGWRTHSSGFKAGIQNVIPFYLGKSQYALTPSLNTGKSSVLELVIQQDI